MTFGLTKREGYARPEQRLKSDILRLTSDLPLIHSDFTSVYRTVRDSAEGLGIPVNFESGDVFILDKLEYTPDILEVFYNNPGNGKYEIKVKKDGRYGTVVDQAQTTDISDYMNSKGPTCKIIEHIRFGQDHDNNNPGRKIYVSGGQLSVSHFIESARREKFNEVLENYLIFTLAGTFRYDEAAHILRGFVEETSDRDIVNRAFFEEKRSSIFSALFMIHSRLHEYASLREFFEPLFERITRAKNEEPLKPRKRDLYLFKALENWIVFFKKGRIDYKAVYEGRMDVLDTGIPYDHFARSIKKDLRSPDRGEYLLTPADPDILKSVNESLEACDVAERYMKEISEDLRKLDSKGLHWLSSFFAAGLCGQPLPKK